MNPNTDYNGILDKKLGDNWSDPVANADAGIKYMKATIPQFKKILGPQLASSLKFPTWTNFA
jgi:hypothetical protein